MAIDRDKDKPEIDQADFGVLPTVFSHENRARRLLQRVMRERAQDLFTRLTDRYIERVVAEEDRFQKPQLPDPKA